MPNFTSLGAENWYSICRGVVPGCVVSAPSEIELTGFSGTLQYLGGILLNNIPLPWDGRWDTMIVSGPLTLAFSFFDDNQDLFDLYATLSPVPEPATWALFGVGLLGLGVMTQRQRWSGGRDRD